MELKLSEKYFFLSFFFSLNFLSFFAGPPDKLAEALIITLWIKIVFRGRDTGGLKPTFFPGHLLNLNFDHTQPVNLPVLKLKRPLFSVMLGKHGKSLYFFIVIFQELCLPVPYNAPVADIIIAGVVSRDKFGFDGGFETDPGVLFKDLDFPAFLGAVYIDSVFLIAEGHGDDVRGFGVGKGEAEESDGWKDGFDLPGVIDEFLASHFFTWKR